MFSRMFLIALSISMPYTATAAGSWNNWTKGLLAGFCAGAGLYWLFKPVSTQTLKKDAEAYYTETSGVYAQLLNKQTNTKELLANTRDIGQTRNRGFWRSFFTSEDSHLGHDAQHRSPLLRGAACMEDDAERLTSHMNKLNERFGSIHAAEREFYNYKNMLALKASLLTLAGKVRKTRDYATAQEHFAQYREQKKLAQEANARLARIENNLNRPTTIQSTSYYLFTEEKPQRQPQAPVYQQAPTFTPAQPARKEKPAAAPAQQRPPAYAPLYPDLSKELPVQPEPSAPEL